MNSYVQEFLENESMCKFVVNKPHSTKAKIKYDSIKTDCYISFLCNGKKLPVDKILNSSNENVVAIIENGNDFYIKCGENAVEILYEKLEIFCNEIRIK